MLLSPPHRRPAAVVHPGWPTLLRAVARRATAPAPRVFVLLAALAAPAAAEADLPLPALLEDYRSLAPVEAGRLVEGWSGTIGHLTLRLEAGSATPLRTPAGETLGVYLEGDGRYEYRTEDPADRAVLGENLARTGHGGLLSGDVVADSFRRAVVFFAAPALEDLWSGEAGTPAALGRESRAAAEQIWKRIAATDLEYDHLAAEARWNGSGTFVFAELEGGKETLGYTLDRVRHFDERLFGFERIQGVEVRLRRRLSQQLVEGGPTAHPSAVVLREGTFEVSTDDNRSGTVASDLVLRSQRDGLRVVPLLLMNNRDPHSYAWASPRHALRVRRVTGGDGTELPFSHRYHEVVVELPSPAAAGEEVRLRFETEGDFFTAGDASGDNYFQLYFDTWYPRPFGWTGEELAFTLRARTRKPFRPVATGETTSFREEGAHYVLETHSDKRVDQIAVFAGKYKTKEKEADGIRIRAHAYAMGTDKALDTLLGLTEYFLGLYGKLLGPYPFQHLDVVEVPSYGFGVAPAGMVLLTSEAYAPQEDFLSSYFSRGVNARLAHEVAHQWFGHVAAPATSRDSWLSESFAEYLSGIAMAVANPDERQVAGFKRMHQEWWAQARETRDAGPLVAARMIGGDQAFRLRYGLLYCRGPLVLHMLRTYTGDAAFQAVLRKFLEQADMGPATTEDFERAMAEVLQADMGWFVEQWVRHGGIPEVKVEHRVETGEGGGLVLAGRAEQSGTADFKRLYIPLLIDYGGGNQAAKFLHMDQPVVEFRYPLDGRPRKVTVDPAQNNLAIYR